MNEKHYELRFLPLFEDDLDEIVDYITYRLKNPAAAERLVDEVETAILERFPCAESFEPFHSVLGSRLLREGLACRLGLRCCVLTHPTVAIDGPRPL